MVDILVDHLFNVAKEPDKVPDRLPIPGYFVRSTARANVEDIEQIERDDTYPAVQDVIDRLYAHHKASPKELGLVISIHGYNTGGADDLLTDPLDSSRDGVLGNYQNLCRYVNQDPCINNPSNKIVYLGYRWPSERIGSNWKSSLKALPFPLQILLGAGVVVAAVSLVLIIWRLGLLNPFSAWLGLPVWLLFVVFLIILIGGVAAIATIFSLFLLRASVYFRDSYRATNYGVPDLVELIRQIDQGLLNKSLDEKLLENFQGKTGCQNLNQSTLAQIASVIRQELYLRRSNQSLQETVVSKLKGYSQLQEELDPITLDQWADTTLNPMLIELNREYPTIQKSTQEMWKGNLVKLSFIAHSMGAHVTTQVIRILSDVFDPSSIGTIGGDQETAKQPSSEVGNVFSLSRLVLVSPDIPSLAIQSGRSNFLRSSLRRFEEAYLFSNEGDLALRLASTAVNYFSFPARTRDEGYRLGNVTVNPHPRVITEHPESSNLKATQDIEELSNYGIVNLPGVRGGKLSVPDANLLKYLEINVLNKDKRQSLDPDLQKIRNQVQKRPAEDKEYHKDEEALADLFTFFDCTEYLDYTDYGKVSPSDQRNPAEELHNVLIKDKQNSPLSLLEYLQLIPAYFFFKESKFLKGCRDTHGGYFYGKFTQLLIYRLAFVGFKELLDFLVLESPLDSKINIKEAFPKAELETARTRAVTQSSQDPAALQEKREVALKYLSWICEQKRLQVVLSPKRYLLDVLSRR